MILHEYGPEQAGQRVGWVSVEPHPDVDQWGRPVKDIDIDVTVATVGKKGARLGYTRREDGSEVRHMPFPESFDGKRPADISGFVAVTGLSATLYMGQSANELQTRLSGNVAKFVTSIPGQSRPEMSWFEDDQDCLKLLRGGLLKHGVEDLYPSLYYQLNAYLGHAGVNRFLLGAPDGFSRRATKIQDPIADPEMIATTTLQRDLSADIEADLTKMIGEDRRSLREFDRVVVDIDPSRAEEDFIKSRQTVSSAEGRIIERSGGLIIKAISYLPVGSRRDWSFMDPTPTDSHPKGNYDRELEDIIGGSLSLARDEIDDEIDELSQRRTLAEQGTDMLSRLHDAELALADKE